MAKHKVIVSVPVVTYENYEVEVEYDEWSNEVVDEAISKVVNAKTGEIPKTLDTDFYEWAENFSWEIYEKAHWSATNTLRQVDIDDYEEE